MSKGRNMLLWFYSGDFNLKAAFRTQAGACNCGRAHAHLSWYLWRRTLGPLFNKLLSRSRRPQQQRKLRRIFCSIRWFISAAFHTLDSTNFHHPILPPHHCMHLVAIKVQINYREWRKNCPFGITLARSEGYGEGFSLLPKRFLMRQLTCAEKKKSIRM